MRCNTEEYMLLEAIARTKVGTAAAPNASGRVVIDLVAEPFGRH